MDLFTIQLICKYFLCSIINKAYLDDFDDLDYEPDGVEKPLEEVSTPEPNGEDLILKPYHR